MMFDAVFFDSGGTLYGATGGPDPSPREVANGRADRVFALMQGMDVAVDDRELAGAIERAEESCRRLHGAGANYLRLIRAVVDDLGLPVGPEVAACLADAYAGPRYASWLFPGTVEAVRKLDEAGYRMGVIANTEWPGFCMDRAFAGVGLLEFFGIRLYSGDLGVEKPDVAIFRHAERLAGLEGGRLLYVGNDPEKDIAGATAAGWATAYRKVGPDDSAGADFEFLHIDELAEYCLAGPGR